MFIRSYILVPLMGLATLQPIFAQSPLKWPVSEKIEPMGNRKVKNVAYVLLVSSQVSRQAAQEIQKTIQDESNVFRALDPASKEMEKSPTGRPWEVIYFDFSLEDAARRRENPAAFQQELAKTVGSVKNSSLVAVWGSTRPGTMAGVIPETVQQFNAAVQAYVESHDLGVCDNAADSAASTAQTVGAALVKALLKNSTPWAEVPRRV